MIDLTWNFPLLRGQEDAWAHALGAVVGRAQGAPVEMQRPSFRTVDSELRARAAAWLGTPAARTWLTCGGHHGTLVALLGSGLAGTAVAVEGASYPGFLDQCRMTRTRIVAGAMDAQGLLPEAVRAAAQAGARGIFTMPTVQNPLGFVTPLERRLAIVEVARELDLAIIEDDAYGFLEQDAPPSYAELASERAWYVRGLAKSLAPGARTGFLLAPEQAEAEIVMALKCTATGTDVPQNEAALSLCEDGTLARVMAAKRAEGAARNAEARALLAGMAVPGAACAWHLWVPMREGAVPGPEPRDLAAAMAERGVLLSSGHWCAAAPEYGNGVRVALGGEVERARTLEGVARLAQVLAGR